MSEKTKADYGYCPECGAPGVMLDLTPFGEGMCKKGHTYPSAKAHYKVPDIPEDPDPSKTKGHAVFLEEVGLGAGENEAIDGNQPQNTMFDENFWKTLESTAIEVIQPNPFSMVGIASSSSGSPMSYVSTRGYDPANPTFGQKAVGITFNPSGDDLVFRLKMLHAEIIDIMNDFRDGKGVVYNAHDPSENATYRIDRSAEQKRHASIAITDAETSQMRAVKAVTWKD